MAGYVDLQVNGYAGVDFNGDQLTPESLQFACEQLTKDGVTAILATLITDDVQLICQRMRAIHAARQAHSTVAQVIVGFHLEGPFLNPAPGYIGAHPAEFARPADLDTIKSLHDVAEGLLRIVTLAPECDDQFRVTSWLAKRNIIVSAGHCNPTYAQLSDAVDAGLSMFTHLGNGCPLEQHRHDNIIQRALSLSDQLRIGFIADGIHVPFFALKNYLSVAGIENAFIVTDAVAAAGLGPGQYRLAGRDVVVDENLATWSADRTHLVGSATTMPRVVENLSRQLKFTRQEIRSLTRENAQRILSLPID